ncbi:MAG: deoxynucleoside kinase [Anaerolineae bacterium]|nr:deoxynucleoside kinase [Anaerolineae bacterium]
MKSNQERFPQYFVAVAGNIGVGKSSLTELLARELSWEPFIEPHADNPYLADFYTDMQRWSFHSQVFFLSRRLQHHRQLIDFPGSVVQDRTVYEDAEIFAANLCRQRQMSQRDFATYCDLYDGVCAFLPPPDLVIYLKASVGALAERINQRGRFYERQISIDYLSQLNELYEEWVANWSRCPIMVVNTDPLDFVHRPKDLQYVLDQVRTYLTLP